jgi:hypothetical protein
MIPAWIAGDPLVGILTTIGFFTFVVVGRTLKLRQLKRKGNG